MRLPHVAPDHPRFGERDVALVGVPWDSSKTNRPGPRQLRDMAEVSPPFDASGGTAFLGVSVMFEFLCPMARRVTAA